MNYWQQFWHKTLKRPYILAKQHDAGDGTPVVLLHGIGRSGKVWQPLVDELVDQSFHVIAFDLLGFGDSPKPDWVEYNIDDHARAVIASILKQRYKQPVLLVGHSLGALVALRVARLRPDLIKHVILYEMPLYTGLPEKRYYKTRIAAYFKFYEWVISQNPSFGELRDKFSERIAGKVIGVEITKATWKPFIKSLKNSIMQQTAADDIKNLTMAADVIYGSRDMLVIRGEVATIFGADSKHVTAYTIKERHRITKVTAHFLVERLQAAEQVGL